MAAALATPLVAQNPVGQDPPALEQPYEWPRLYSDPAGSLLQEVALQGRFQIQWAESISGNTDFGSVNAPEFSRWGDAEVRRWRLGLRARFLDHWTIDGHVNVRPDLEPAYLSLYDLQLVYSRDPSFALAIGKTKVPYTQEYAISSARIPTIERSLLTNQVITTPLTGVAAFGQVEDWRYRIGFYANDPRPLDEFSRFDAGAAMVTKLARDLGRELGLQHAWIGIDTFLHTEPPANGQPAYSRSATVTCEIEQSRFGFLGDLLWSGGERIDNVGLTLLPTFRIGPDLQAVLRYHVARSAGGDGISPPLRYDRFAPDVVDALTVDGRGDEVQTLYLGCNWFLRGHQAKVMTGVEYTDLSGGANGGGYRNWTFYTAFRFVF